MRNSFTQWYGKQSDYIIRCRRQAIACGQVLIVLIKIVEVGIMSFGQACLRGLERRAHGRRAQREHATKLTASAPADIQTDASSGTAAARVQHSVEN